MYIKRFLLPPAHLNQFNERFFVGSLGRLLFPLQKVLRGGILFVEPDEYSDYNTLHKKHYGIVRLKDGGRGFGFLLNSMLEYAKQNEFEYYFFCDDDVLGIYSRTRGDTANEILNKMVEIFELNNYAQLMLSFNGHNWYQPKGIIENVGAWGFILCRTKALSSVGGYDETLPIYNDWDMSAKLLSNGYKTASYYGGSFEHKMKSLNGGAEKIYKRQENLSEAEQILKLRYGSNCFKSFNKHGQKEIRFKWNTLTPI